MNSEPYILIVEDDADLREAVAELLQDHGYGTCQVANGVEALEVLRERSSACLMLLDLMMPVMNGWELLARIEEGAVSPVPDVVIMTALEMAPRTGGRKVLLKPLNIEQLLSEVDGRCR
jgi:two-component system chemotaxis response regulator CheY